jgi:hypothetical protein
VSEAPQYGELNLLIEWESPWEAFTSSIRPAVQRSPLRLQGECQSGLFPYSGMAATWVLEVLLLIAVIVLPAKLMRLVPFQPPPNAKYDVIYYSGDYLPQTRDVTGAEQGVSGRSGGRESRGVQTIKVARGDSLTNRVVDAPKLHLPQSDDVKNLLAIAAKDPGPPPTAGLEALNEPKLTIPVDVIAPSPGEVTRSKLAALPVIGATAVPPRPDVNREKLPQAQILNSTVVQPSPNSVQRDVVSQARIPSLEGAQVVPPPISAPVRDSDMNARLTLPAPAVVQPPPDTGIVHGLLAAAGALFGTTSPSAVPPPIDPVGGAVSSIGTGTSRNGGSLSGGADVVPPPVDVGGGSSFTHGGRGGAGGTLAGLGAVPVLGPTGNGSGGSGKSSGVVISAQPGSGVGVPGNGGEGMLAMSPNGGDTPGLGGSGGGAGIGNGTGPGNGTTGEGSGSAATGTGYGSSPTAHGGIVNGNGPGGAGEGGGGSRVPGVAISGGSGVVNLPSFSEGGNAPGVSGRMPSQPGINRPAIEIVATPRSGGALNLYGMLKGDKVYTIYVETHPGFAIMQFSDPSSAGRGFGTDLIAPEALRAQKPPGLNNRRLLISCKMDRSGILRDMKVLEGPALTPREVAVLESWRFRPVLRGNDPIDVDAVVGFNIDTR